MAIAGVSKQCHTPANIKDLRFSIARVLLPSARQLQLAVGYWEQYPAVAVVPSPLKRTAGGVVAIGDDHSVVVGLQRCRQSFDAMIEVGGHHLVYPARPVQVIPSVPFEAQFEQTLAFYGQSHFALRRDLRACQACAVAHGVEILLGFGRGVGLVEAFGIHEQHVGVAVYDVVATAGARLQALVVHVKVF